MRSTSRITLADLVCGLRQNLLIARERKDLANLTILQNTLDILRDIAWNKEDESLAAIIQDMVDASRDALMGVDWKSSIPSEEQIRSILSYA